MSRIISAADRSLDKISLQTPYFTLRKEIGYGYLDLLRFYLNHVPFMRSENPKRKGKSPAELLTGKPHPHWLEMLGFKRFKRAA